MTKKTNQSTTTPKSEILNQDEKEIKTLNQKYKRNLKIKISGFAKEVKGKRQILEDILSPSMEKCEIKRVSHKVIKDIAKEFREENKELIDDYKTTSEKVRKINKVKKNHKEIIHDICLRAVENGVTDLDEDTFKLAFSNLLFLAGDQIPETENFTLEKEIYKIDEDLSLEEKYKNGREKELVKVVDVDINESDKEYIIKKKICGKNPGAYVYEFINGWNSGDQLFTRDAILELGLQDQLPSEENIDILLRNISNDDSLIQIILKKDTFRGTGFLQNTADEERLESKVKFEIGSYIDTFLSDGRIMRINIPRHGDEKVCIISGREEKRPVACVIYLKKMG